MSLENLRKIQWIKLISYFVYFFVLVLFWQIKNVSVGRRGESVTITMQKWTKRTRILNECFHFFKGGNQCYNTYIYKARIEMNGFRRHCTKIWLWSYVYVLKDTSVKFFTVVIINYYHWQSWFKPREICTSSLGYLLCFFFEPVSYFLYKHNMS